MPATPEPDYDLLVANGSTVAPRIDLMLRELKRRLYVGMPGMIASANSLNDSDGQGGLIGEYAFDGVPLKGIAGVRYGGTPNEGESEADWIFLKCLDRITPAGLAAEFDNNLTLLVYVLGETVQRDAQAEMCIARAQLVVEYLTNFIGGCCDLSGRKVWRDLIPLGFENALPESMGQYNGVTLTFAVRLSPNTF